MSLKVALLLASCGLSSVAFANGRFPRAQRLAQDAEDPRVLAIYGTYGLLVTTDAAQSWQYVCEGATGPYSGEDPLLEILPAGRVVVGTDLGLAASKFPTCDWQLSLVPEMPGSVQDITRHPNDPSTLLALLSRSVVGAGYESSIRASLDAGASWKPASVLPSDRIVRGLTLDLAPSTPDRLYVSGFNDAGEGVLLRTDDVGHADAGTAWQAFPIPETGLSAAPYIAAIDPIDADRLFVRTDVTREISGVETPEDTLWYSGDGGSSWTNVLRRQAKLLGFALSPDNRFLLAAYGDPLLYGYIVKPDQMGIYRIPVVDLEADPTTAAGKFEKIYAGNVTCLRWNDQGLFACVVQSLSGFELGRATDASFTMTTARPFQPLLDLTKVLPLACGPDTQAAACLTDVNVGWPSVCLPLQADCDYGQAPLAHKDAGLRDASVAPVDGSSQIASDAGSSSVPTKATGCGCRIEARALTDRSAGFALLVVALWWRRRHDALKIASGV